MLSEEAKEAQRKYRREWRKKNKEAVKKYYKKWSEQNKDKIKQYTENYWEKKGREAIGQDNIKNRK